MLLTTCVILYQSAVNAVIQKNLQKAASACLQHVAMYRTICILSVLSLVAGIPRLFSASSVITLTDENINVRPILKLLQVVVVAVLY